MEYKILNINNHKEYEEWTDIISNFNVNKTDFYYLPNYMDLNVNNHKNEVGLMFYVRENNHIWVHCFIKTKILNYEKIFEDKFYYDLETPHGYGGPISNTENEFFLKKAQNFFFEWANRNNILCELVRFHPLLNNQIYYNSIDKIILNREIRFTKLNLITEELTCFNPKVRNKIRKAYKDNLLIEISKSKKDYNDFKVLYFQHLNNINAENFYYFNEIYFKKLFDLINKFGFIVTVKNESKELLGASVFLGFKKNLHSHLTAISKTNKFSGINNVLLYNAYLYGKNNNFINCNLGGGISCNQDDSLLEFKRSMSNSKSNFYIGYKIYNEKIYSNLVNSYKKRYPAKFKINSKHILCYRSND